MPCNMALAKDSIMAHLPLSDPRCLDDSCLAFQEAEAGPAAMSSSSQLIYGHSTVYTHSVIVFLFAVKLAWYGIRD